MDGLLLAIAASAAVTDVRQGKVHNVLTYTGVIAGLVLNAVLPAGIGLGQALLGLVVGFVPLFLAYLAGGLGGGDVKLMAAVGAFVGPAAALWALLYTSIVGAALCLALILWKEGSAGLLVRMSLLARKEATDEPRADRLRFPFAVAVLAGAAWVITERNLGRSLLDAARGVA
jgi:prepilin peptidase CpaA